MSMVFELNISGLNYSYALQLPLLILAICIIKFFLHKDEQGKRLVIHLDKVFLKPAFFLAVIICMRISIGQFMSSNVTPFRYVFLNSLSWVIVLAFSVLFDVDNLNRNLLSLIALGAMVISGSWYVKYLDTVYIYSELRPLAVNSIFYVICLLPLALLNPKKKFQYLAFCIAGIFILYSDKATMFIMYVSILCAYIVFKDGVVRSRTIKVFILGIILIVGYFFLNSKIELLGAVQKIRRLDETGGSNRIPIYIYTIKSFFNGNLFQIVFGRGYNGVANYLGVSAHNDFLEVLYDYGIFGFVSYLLVVAQMIRTSCFLIKIKDEYAMPVLVSIIIFIIGSTVSHLIFVPRYFLFIVLLWGIVLKKLNRNKDGGEYFGRAD